jgi:hypothetical protein
MLKSKIPTKTWAEWDDANPGFVEIDLVGANLTAAARAPHWRGVIVQDGARADAPR